jgi:hypothetical protein
MDNAAPFWIVVTIGCLLLGGWIANIVKLADMCCDMSGLLLVRVAGIFVAPLGAVMGFI